MKKLLILFSLSLMYTLSITAQTQDKKWNIGLHGGATQYNGDLGNDFYKTKMPFYGLGGLSVSRYLGTHLDINFFAAKGTLGYNRSDGYFNSQFTSALLNVRFNILGPNTPVRPYIFLGGGAILFDKNLDITKEKIDYVAPSFGGGINFKLGPSVMLNLQETFLYSTEDKRDGIVKDRNDAYLFHTAGLTFNFGNKKDADKDGIADRTDKCPNTPMNTAVDKKGCPLDNDKDGIADYLDKCPDIAGVEALNGCADKDGDGIADSEDRCADIAGPASLKGCPDMDNDGVADMDDKCPATVSGVQVDAFGCQMDNDKDGVMNENDRCPDAAGIASLKGCPDGDGDGIPDIDDRCPTVKGSTENKGCPVITKEDIKKITQIASKIFFETNSDKLKAASWNQLDELVLILKKYETANLLIAGHTDSKGADDFNMNLSQKRTESVKAYLMDKGIMESRLTTNGLGETMPIADNNTTAGRSKNRRVELSTSY